MVASIASFGLLIIPAGQRCWYPGSCYYQSGDSAGLCQFTPGIQLGVIHVEEMTTAPFSMEKEHFLGDGDFAIGVSLYCCLPHPHWVPNEGSWGPADLVQAFQDSCVGHWVIVFLVVNPVNRMVSLVLLSWATALSTKSWCFAPLVFLASRWLLHPFWVFYCLCIYSWLVVWYQNAKIATPKTLSSLFQFGTSL